MSEMWKGCEVGMTDREKVIKGLECCKIPFTKCYDGGCPYFENDGCKARLKGDALALLKAQEPVEPVRRRRHGQIGYSCFCGMCGYGIGRNEKYCALCGRAVKWE